MQVQGIPAEIEVIRSSRKTLSAEITANGHVLVRSPMRLPEREIVRFLTEKADAINRLLQRYQAAHEKSDALPPFTLREIEEMADRAMQIIPPRVAYYAKQLGVTYGRITIRNQKTRWGSCTADGNLNFNCLLVMAPPEVLDSVVVHELCHRIHHNHSKAFYAEIARVFPDYDRCAKWLKENGGTLISRMLRGLS